MESAKQKLSVLILNYNTGDFLAKCLRSLERVKNEAELDIWVIDNGSTDESLMIAQKEFPKQHYIEIGKNIGFARGNNLGLKKLKGKYILILNPDTVVFPGTLSTLLDYMEEHVGVGACSPRVEHSDGKLDWASHRGFPTPLASFLYFFFKDDRLYHLSGRDFDKTHEVDCLSGACILTRKEILNKVGLFDESYFMYGEDLDLCYRIKKAGYKVMYLPQVKIIHYQGVSSGLKKHTREITTACPETKMKAFNAFYDAMKIFYKKNLAVKYPFFLNWMVYFAIDLGRFLAKRKMTV